MDSKFLLSIAIPTYNRSSYLKTLLTCLEPQLKDESRVELLVSDNCSPDDTPEVVRSFQQRGMSIRYVRNENNIGADANFLQCYDLAAGSYVWVFGDDDILVEGGLKQVLSNLETRKYDLVHVRAFGFENEYRPSNIPLTGRKREFRDAVEFALFIYTGFTFISGNIASKEKLESLQHPDFKDFVGTNLVQLSWIFALLQNNARCLYLEDPLVASKANNSGGHGTCQVFGSNLHKIVTQYFGAESKISRAILNKTIQSWFPWAIVQGRRSTSSHSHEDPEKVLRPVFSGNPRYWFFLYPVLKLPKPLDQAWLRFVQVINVVDRRIGHPIAS